MTSFFTYRNAPGATAFDIDLLTAVRLGEIPGFTSLAEHMQVGASSIVLDNPQGTIGHSSDNILGHQRFEWDESAESVGNRRVWQGFVGERVYRRGSDTRKSLITEAASEVEVGLFDLNAIPSFRIIPKADADADRPKETVSQRMTWILGSEYLSGLVADNGLVAASSVVMEKTDYRGQRPVNAIGDCEYDAGFNAFIYPDETQTVIPSLFFDDPNTSTAYASTLRLSNVLSDLDTKTDATFLTGLTYAPSKDASLRRSPTNLGSGIYVPWAQDAEYITRPATAAIYGYRDIVYPDSNTKTKAAALRRGRRMLREHSTEEDRIEVEVQLPRSRVNHIRAGHRLSVKFSHLPGYTSFTWTRVVRCTPIERDKADDRYTLQLTLVPQEAAPASLCGYELTPAGDYYPLGDQPPTGPSEWYAPNVSDGVTYYLAPKVYYPTVPTPGAEGWWHFIAHIGAGGAGSKDFAGDCAQNTLQFIVVGAGTLTVQTEIWDGVRPMAGSWGESPDAYANSIGTFESGDEVEFVITGQCVNIVRLYDGPGSPCGGKWGWSVMHWEPA